MLNNIFNKAVTLREFFSYFIVHSIYFSNVIYYEIISNQMSYKEGFKQLTKNYQISGVFLSET